MFNMKKFCSDETDPRWYLHNPFAWHGFLGGSGIVMPMLPKLKPKENTP